jgi:8-oxo-dGTP diphosphatase
MALTHAGGLVFRHKAGKNYYLIIRAKPDPSHWVIPKGHIEIGETPEAAAIREILEETGVQAQIITTLGHLKFFYRGREIDTIMYLLEYLGEISPMEERESRWGRYEEINSLLTFEDTRKILHLAHEIVLQIDKERR